MAALSAVANASPSVPTGLYLVRARRRPRVGTTVVYPGQPLDRCLAQGRYLPRGVPLIRPVLALEGQTVCRAGVRITRRRPGHGNGAGKRPRRAGAPELAGCRVIAASERLRRFPEVHDGRDRLGTVYEARGDHRQATACYRKIADFVRAHPDRYDPGYDAMFQKLADKLDPPSAHG